MISRVRVLNIKENNETCLEALSKLELELESLKLDKSIRVLEVIHGYGSSGKGGIIKKQLHILLAKLKAQKKILDYSPNEKFSSQNNIYKHFIKLYPELILDENLQNLNPGITIIFLL